MTFKPARLLMVLLAAVAFPVVAQNLAMVNGKPIPTSRVDAMVKQAAAQGQKDGPELRQMIKEELINREILIQEADKLNLSNSADVKTQMDLARQQILIGSLVKDYIRKHPVSDAEIKTEYDRFKAQTGDKEYKARHILVEKEEDAKAIIAKLKGGAKFEELAKQSKDTGSAANGGDLDWATPASFVKEFSTAMVALKNGQVTDTPVKTQFGFHVIRLDESRAAKVPALDEVKGQISEALQQKKLQAYQAELRTKAKIQ